MKFFSSFELPTTKFSWKNQRDEEILIEEDYDITETSSHAPHPQKSQKFSLPSYQFSPQLTQIDSLRLILLTFLILMLIGMLVTSVMLAFHGPRKAHKNDGESLPSAFALKHSRISNLTICLTIFKISEANAACLVHTDKNFYGAQEMCSNYGMDLLEINSEEEKVKVYEETQKLFGSGGGTRIWVNGKWLSQKSAWVSHPKNSSFYLTSDHVEMMSWGVKEADGRCLAIESIRAEKYHIGSCPCYGQHYFYCEYQ